MTIDRSPFWIMKFYLRNFLLILLIAFGSIFCWLVFISTSHNATTVSPNQFKNFFISKHSRISGTRSSENISYHGNSLTESPFTKPNHGKRIRNIICNINGEYNINCLKLITGKNTSIYVPFTFIHKYFEINGKLVKNQDQDQEEYFEWNHSYSKIFFPDQPYDPHGKFLWFGNYNVEFRERVKCISAQEHVPISTQWYPQGHLYPTQISQYGLSHFNKNLTSPRPAIIKLVDNGLLNSDHIDSNSILIPKKNFVIIQDAVIGLKNIPINHLICQFQIQIPENASIRLSIVHDNVGDKRPLQIVYSSMEKPIDLSQIKNDTVIYGIGNSHSEWIKLTRDLIVDLFKGSLISDRKRNNYHLFQVTIDGIIRVKRFHLKNTAHEDFAMAAGDWLIRNQNPLGGWEIKVKRKLAKGALVINEGWHSAMAQGQAISLLTRLFKMTNDQVYLDSAKKALNIFELGPLENGVKAILFDKFNWYEEYPTVPSIFVLNGFMYSLFGLYDLSKACQDDFCQKAGQLYEDGLGSLEATLPLFDSGSGSFYDLRHLNLGIAPNLARWDYHSTHINQLLFLYTIARNDLFKSTSDRWIAYMKGHRASHN